MKIYRVRDDKKQVRLATSTDGHNFTALEGEIFSGNLRPTGEPLKVHSLLSPVAPTAIFGIGLNYAKHAEETKATLPEKPILFMKAPTTAQAPGGPIVLPRALRSDRVDYEGELAVVIGRTCKNVKREDALNFVAGYTIANDVSARDWQIKWGGGQWCRGKTFDTFCPLGPCLVTPDEIPNPNDLALSTKLNGKTMQLSRTLDMIFDIPTLIEFLSGSTTLAAGTVILTGTPSGVGMSRDPKVWLQPGDHVDIEIEKIGILSNPVVEEAT
jgi:2-keto-4-pentenoate hydratase/2-oxohepta-3-ene-1,7-dioic acid hydratase in catechol pathway